MSRGSPSQNLRTVFRDQRGQASVELIGVLPFVLVALLIVWQLALAGHTLWLTANAARVAARAELVGADAPAAARSAVPAGLRKGVEVSSSDDGRTTVRVPLPLVHPGWTTGLKASASASLQAAE